MAEPLTFPTRKITGPLPGDVIALAERDLSEVIADFDAAIQHAYEAKDITALIRLNKILGRWVLELQVRETMALDRADQVNR